MAFNRIDARDLEGKGVLGQSDVPGLSALDMQNKVEELSRGVIIPHFNQLIDKLTEYGAPVESGEIVALRTSEKGDLQFSTDGQTWFAVADHALAKKADAENVYTKSETEEAISRRVIEIGTADMSMGVYDTDHDGVVNRADVANNGVFIYTHSGHNLTGSGTNGQFKATSSGNFTSFNINGTRYAAKTQGETGVDIIAGAWYAFVLDLSDNTINFKRGGAGLNFRIVGGTSQPASPTENTIWVETQLAVKGFQFSHIPPQTRPDGSALVTGDVWVVIDSSRDTYFNALKKDCITVCVDGCYQWDGTEWAYKKSQIYIDGVWHRLETTIIYVNTDGVNTDAVGDMTLIVYTSATVQEKQLVISSGKGDYTSYPTAFAEKKVSLTGRNTLTVTFKGGTNYHPIVFGVHTNKTTAWNNIATKCAPYGTEQIDSGNSSIKNMNTFTYDVSQFNGDYYLFVGGRRNANYGSTVTIKEWYLD